MATHPDTETAQLDAAHTPPTIKGVVFTHFGGLKYSDELKERQDEIVEEYRHILLNYLRCERISVVYAYVDWGFKKLVVDMLGSSKPGSSNPTLLRLLQEEAHLMGMLHEAEVSARVDAGLKRDEGPVFHFVGINKLVALVNELIDIDRSLLDLVRGPDGEFTYDSPKFVEAVIRVARGNIAHLAPHPIIRLDEDVECNSDAIDLLVKEYARMTRLRPYFLFSGTYSDPTGTYDPVNDHAVRLHWFVDPATQISNVDLMRKFVADLNELGATQIVDSEKYYSSAMQDLLNSGRPTCAPARETAQLISGAGLIMSHIAIRMLPPFMNFKGMAVWVDDHLKRRLHEALQDIRPRDLELVTDCIVKQSRHPDGVSQENIDGTDAYLERLMRGCALRRLITNLDGSQSDYSKLIDNITRYRIKSTADVLTDFAAIRDKLIEGTEERYDEVVKCWSAPEFSGYASFNWATREAPRERRRICDELVDDVKAYALLVQKWPVFLRAIERLDFLDNTWLFEPCD